MATDHERDMRIVIIGGGISGLSSAFYLRRMAAESGIPLQVTIIEKSDRLGGKIETLRTDGFVIEKGPDSFLTRKQAIIDLADDLGIAGELTKINPSGKRAYIVHRNRLYPMPQGLVLGVPTEVMPFATTGLLSPLAKLRAALDFVLPARKGTQDESVGSFLERRMGTEVVERVAEPLLAGIYAGELNKLSLRATFPQFRESERRYGSLIRGMRMSVKKGAAGGGTPVDPRFRGATFLTFRRGLSTMVEALDAALADCDRRMGRSAVGVRKVDAGASAGAGAGAGASAGMGDARGKRYAVELDNGETLAADAVIVSTPAFAAAPLLDSHVDVTALRKIGYVSVANVVLAFDKAAFGLDFAGSGFLVPRTEGRHITACTWTSSKWLHTSPQDKVLLRCYVGRANDEASVELPDDQLAAAVLQDIRDILGIRADVKPLFTEITRLRHSMPQYPVGHVEAIQALQAELSEQLPGVYVIGNAIDGIGLPDCIRQGKATARQALGELSGQKE
jgi:protoporphyrinogen/coproporphyrinogen III oxidase